MAYHMEFDKNSDTWHIHTGPYERPEVIPLDQRRMIFVPAVPSSGTSMIAGVLHHLGVNMGSVTSNKPLERGYQQYECMDVSMFTATPNGPTDHLVNQRIRFLEYLNFRYLKDREGRLGVKTLPTVWMNDLNPVAWPIDILDVRRPLEVSLEKDQERLAKRPERVKDGEPLTGWLAMNRYGGLAAMSWARDRLLEFHPPLMTVDYDDFRENAPTRLDEIVQTFGLNPNDRQMTMALLSVEAKKR